MASAVFSNSLLKSKFRGCMIGVLIGDCIGKESFFEDLGDLMINLMSSECEKILPHTDDTRMTISVASSLADKDETNAKDMAERFVEDFYQQPNRGYGSYVVYVFIALKESKCEDVFLPAKAQFNGTGSWGNGASMRIAPIALFGNSRGEEYIMKAAKECSLITHAHPNGYNGAILQCLAVNIALGLDPSQELDPVWFISSLLEKMKNVETMEIKPYCESLEKMKEYFLENWEDVSSTEIAKTLGNGFDISALKSVPSAIYSFLRGMKPFKDFFKLFYVDSTDKVLNPVLLFLTTCCCFSQRATMGLCCGMNDLCLLRLWNSNSFLRTLLFAISLGGDTDTIGSMASSIAGAYYGEDMIPKVLQKKCESVDEIISLADKLFDAAYKKE